MAAVEATLRPARTDQTSQICIPLELRSSTVKLIHIPGVHVSVANLSAILFLKDARS